MGGTSNPSAILLILLYYCISVCTVHKTHLTLHSFPELFLSHLLILWILYSRFRVADHPVLADRSLVSQGPLCRTMNSMWHVNFSVEGLMWSTSVQFFFWRSITYRHTLQGFQLEANKQ